MRDVVQCSRSAVWLPFVRVRQSRLLVKDCAAKLEAFGLQGAIQEVSMIKVWTFVFSSFRVRVLHLSSPWTTARCAALMRRKRMGIILFCTPRARILHPFRP